MSRQRMTTRVSVSPNHTWDVRVEFVKCDECGEVTPFEFSDHFHTLWESEPQSTRVGEGAPISHRGQRYGDFCSWKCAAAYLTKDAEAREGAF